MMVVAEEAGVEGGEPTELGRAFVQNRPQLPHQKPGIETVSGWTAINGPSGCIRLENFCVIGPPPPPPALNSTTSLEMFHLQSRALPHTGRAVSAFRTCDGCVDSASCAHATAI